MFPNRQNEDALSNDGYNENGDLNGEKKKKKKKNKNKKNKNKNGVMGGEEADPSNN